MTYALFADGRQAGRALVALQGLGVRDEALSLLRNEDVTDNGSATTSGPALTTTPDREGDSITNHDAGNAEKAAGGLAVGAVASFFLLPGLGIMLGAGALAAALSAQLDKQTGAAPPPSHFHEYLQREGLTKEAVASVESTLAGGGALLQVDETKEGTDITEAHVAQNVSDHGGRIIWGANVAP